MLLGEDHLECSDKDWDSSAITELLVLGFGSGQQWREDELKRWDVKGDLIASIKTRVMKCTSIRRLSRSPPNSASSLRLFVVLVNTKPHRTSTLRDCSYSLVVNTQMPRA